MHISQYIQSQLYDFISHRFKDITVDRFSMETRDWNLYVTGKYSFIMSLERNRPITVSISEISRVSYTDEAYRVRKTMEELLNENIKYN